MPSRQRTTRSRRSPFARTAPLALAATLLAPAACRSDAERAELAEAAQLVEHIDRLRRADNADKGSLVSALSGADCHGPEACALKDLCLRAYRLHQGALDQIAAARGQAERDAAARSAGASARDLARLEAIQLDLTRARELTERCAEEQVRLMRSKLL